jgi:hypothetical protein
MRNVLESTRSEKSIPLHHNLLYRINKPRGLAQVTGERE